MSGVVPLLAARPLGRAAGVPRPVCPGCGRCGRGDPAPAPQHAPLRAGVARCGGGGRASPGGVPCTVVRGVCGQALPLPQLPAHWAGCSGPPPTCCGRGYVGVGAQHCPLGLHALWGLHAVGVVGGRPRDGWPATVVRGIWCQALSLPRPPALWGGRLGFRDPCVPGAVGAGWGPSTSPKACALAGRRCSLWGWRKGVPGGGAFNRCEGRLWSGAPPPPTAQPLGGLFRSATHVLWARVCGCGGLTRSPWPACPVGAAFRGGGGGPSPGGVACHRCEGRLVSGAVPPPAARPLGRAARVPRPVCPGCSRCGRGDPAPAPQRAPLWAGVARCGGGGRASPGGMPSTVVRGVCGQALPLPRLPAHWAGCWGALPTCCGRGYVVVGAQHCPLGLHALWGLRAVGVVGGRPRGGWPATFVRGVWCQALSLPRPPALWGGQPGFRGPCIPGAVGAGVGTLHWPHGACPCGPALRAVGVAVGRPRRVALRRCQGRLGSSAPPPPAACRLGGLPGLAGHVLWARVWVCAVCVVSVRCVSWCVVPLFSCPSGAPLSGASVRCGGRGVPCACRAPFPEHVPCSAAGYPLFRSRRRHSFPFPLLALLPGMHFFPASALVCVSVFLFASFLSHCAL